MTVEFVCLCCSWPGADGPRLRCTACELLGRALDDPAERDAPWLIQAVDPPQDAPLAHGTPEIVS